jgi:hypothetical protein
MATLINLPFAAKQMKIKVIAIGACVILAVGNLVKIFVKDNELGSLYAVGFIVFTTAAILFLLDWLKSKRQGVICLQNDEIVFHRGPILTLAYPQSAIASVVQDTLGLTITVREGTRTITRSVPLWQMDASKVDAFVRSIRNPKSL